MVYRVIRSIVCHIRRESYARYFGFRVLIDSLLLDPLYAYVISVLGKPNMLEKGRRRVIERRMNAVEHRYNVKFADCPFFPPDILWQDYLQLVTFYPKPDSVVLDVGANIGDWSIIVGKYFRARVIAIEPVSSAFRYLERNIELNSLEERVIAINCALGSYIGTTTFHADIQTGYATLSNSNVGLSSPPAQYPLETLDNIVKSHKLQSVYLIKIDVEGSEVTVLEGCEQTIVRFKPKFIVEVHSLVLRELVIAYFTKHDYSMMLEKVNFVGFISVLYFSPSGPSN